MVIALQLTGGTLTLYYGAEWLVRGSSALALRLGFPPLLVGLTVVAYGTSAPEFIVSLAAALNGQTAIALGNAIGSNIVNIGLILGLTAVVCPLHVHLQLLKLDTPVMVGAALLFLAFFVDQQIGRGEAATFVVLLVLYTLFNVRLARQQQLPVVEEEFASSITGSGPAVWLSVQIVAGLLALALGAQFFVAGATRVAELAGISEGVIGLTVVAIGTSLPELITSAVAAVRKQADIAVGNIVGSTICNILATLGVAGVLAGPLEGSEVAVSNVAVMTAFVVGMTIIAWTGFKLTRWEGALLLICYVSYLAWLWPA